VTVITKPKHLMTDLIFFMLDPAGMKTFTQEGMREKLGYRN